MQKGENDRMKTYDLEAVEYIAKLADGGLRDSLSLLDKCLAYSTELTLENVVKTLGTVNYSDMFALTGCFISGSSHGDKDIINIIEDIHNAGKDIKQFVKQYGHFLLDVQKYAIGCDWKYINIPRLDTYENWLSACNDDMFAILHKLMKVVIRLNSDIKYSNTPKLDLEAVLILFYNEVTK